MGGTESLQECRITAGGAEKSHKCYKYFLQYSKFASEKLMFDQREAPNFIFDLGAI